MDTNNDFKLRVLHSLHLGRDKALKGKELCQRLGERDTRQIRLAIQDLIEEGYPIIGLASKGYFIADNIEDCRENLETLMSYIKMLARHHKYLLKASQKKFSGQLSMKI